MKLLYKIFASQEILHLWPYMAAFAAIFLLLGIILALRKKTALATLSFFIVAAVAGFLFMGNFIASDVTTYAQRPFSSDDTKFIFYIAPGETLTKVANRLVELKLITQPEKFIAYAKFSKKASIKKRRIRTQP